MLNEKITENLVRKQFRKYHYYDNNNIIIDEQKSTISQINKLLQNASKKGSGKGYPEFIIKPTNINNFVCVVECKADVTKHQSKNLDRYSDYAVDGAKLYSDYLSKEFDVLFIGVSGQNEKELKVSHYFQLKGEKEIQPAFDNKILNFESYIETYKEVRFRIDYQELVKYVRTLNEKLHQKKIPEEKRAILFSGILIALEDQTFLESYNIYTDAKRLGDKLIESIVVKLKDSNIHESRALGMKQAFSFITTHTTLIDDGYLIELIKEIDNNIRTFVKNNQYCDIISQAYVEFLKYANNDSRLGIVLTPSHITDLFCDISGITKNSVVIDNCCGTGGFLVTAMKKMIYLSKGNKNKIAEIKKNQLVGIEYQDHIFTLCCSNMILHGDGKTNIIKADCFKKNNLIQRINNKYKPTIGLLNPPYNNTDKDELEFILNNLELIENNGVVVAIVPMRCALYQKGKGVVLKQKILNNHTLEAVLSMPDDLFYPIGNVVTCIMVIKAHQPHPKEYKTYFGYWKNDGFIKRKHQGKVETPKWKFLKNKWLNSLKNKETEKGFSITKAINTKDEWCVETYMETDYNILQEEDFIKNIKSYLSYLFNKTNSDFSIQIDSLLENKKILDIDNWKYFNYDTKEGGIFNIKKGKRLTKDEQIIGNTPYVSSSSLNNGVDNYINNEHTEQNCITFACYGSIGEVFYQNEKVWVSDNANVFYLRNQPLNPFIALFLVTVLKLEKYRFSYGMTAKKERLQNFKIKLPVDKNNKPDWQFMENYIKSLPYSKSL